MGSLNGANDRIDAVAYGDDLEQAATRAPAQQPQKRTTRAGSGTNPHWAMAALASEIAAVSGAVVGERNDTLNRAAFNLGQLVAGGHLAEGTVISELERAARSCGLDEHETTKTIASGLSAGQAEPRRAPEPRPRSSASTRPLAKGRASHVMPRLPEGVAACSDLGNAHRLVLWHGAELRHHPALGWLAWDGTSWRDDAAAHAARMAQDASCRLRVISSKQIAQATEDFARAAAAVDDESDTAQRAQKANQIAEALFKWSSKSQARTRLDAALAIASTLAPVACSPDIWDRQPMLLGALNGTIDLSTGQLRPARRDDYITRLVSVPYEPSAAAPTFERFMADILPSEAVRGFVWRSLGYSLTGLTEEQCFYLLHGTGANGKSTLLEIILFILGAYSATTGTDTLMTVRQRGADNDLARLRGARFVSASESGEQRSFDEERVKRLTGGDTFTARKLYHEPFEFRPEFKLWLAANHKPEIRGTDLGIWRRVRLVPFEVTVPPERQDPKLPEKLRAEASGILAWMVRGCLEWQASGLQAPSEVTDATAGYRADQAVVQRFIAERCVLRDDVSCPAGMLYGAFVDWAKASGELSMSKKAFGQRLAVTRLRASRTKRGRYWAGIGLLSKEVT